MRDRKGVYLDGIGSHDEQGGEVGGKNKQDILWKKNSIFSKTKNNKK